MKSKGLGRTGERIPELGIGTWKMGARPESEIAAIRKAISLGMGFVDTAEMYGNEALVGRALEGQKEFFLATKVSPHHFGYDGVIRACRASLSRLGVRSIDLYQLHWPNGRVDIRETMSAMERLVDLGLVRHIGISNFSVEETRGAQEAMKRHEIASNQVEYSLLVREIEADGLASYCRKNGITVIAYSPVARGAMLDGSQAALSAELGRIAGRHGKTGAQAALNWVISHENTVAIPKSSSPAHVEENAGASGWRMTKEEGKRLESAAVAKRPAISGIKPLMSNLSFISGAYQGISSFRNRKSHLSSSTTRSSKK
jgi:diketogulonate reductase-like aldo/keto reductase